MESERSEARAHALLTVVKGRDTKNLLFVEFSGVFSFIDAVRQYRSGGYGVWGEEVWLR